MGPRAQGAQRFKDGEGIGPRGRGAGEDREYAGIGTAASGRYAGRLARSD